MKSRGPNRNISGGPKEARPASRPRKPSFTIIAAVVAVLVAVGVLLWPGDDATSPGSDAVQDDPAPQVPNTNRSEVDNPMVTIETDSGAKIEIELYPDIAPNTVNNFVSLVKKGFYDGTIFHRVIPGFMIQGGDPDGRGTGGPGYSIKGEFSANGFQNDLKHSRGVLSMARAQHPDSAGSQFFIMVADAPHLDGQYAAFGKVVSGMEEVDRIVSVPRGAQDRPHDPPAMVKVTVDEQGVDYPEPEIIQR